MKPIWEALKETESKPAEKAKPEVKSISKAQSNATSKTDNKVEVKNSWDIDWKDPHHNDVYLEEYWINQEKRRKKSKKYLCISHFREDLEKKPYMKDTV